MAKAKNEDTQFEGFGYFYDRFVNWVIAMPSKKRKSNLILGSIIVIVLTVLASIKFVPASWYIWVQTIIGLPAGIIFFGILVGLSKTTRVGEWSIFQFKANNSAAQRIKKLLIVIAIIVIFFILIGPILANYYGVGGTLMTAIFLTVYNVLRRTPEEIALAKQGIPDPRDIIKGEE